MAKEDCVAIAKKLIDCFNKNDANNLNVFDETLDQKVKYRDLHSPDKAKDLNAFKQAEKEYITAFPNKKVKIDEVLAVGDNKVILRWTTTATHKGNFHGIAATNKEIKYCGMTLFQCSNNKIVEAWQSWDRLGLLEQIGALHAHK